MAYSLTYSYRQTSKTYSVSGASNITTDDGVVIIPSTYNDGINGKHAVTDIRAEAFKNCYGLTSVTIPDSVTSIGSGAFNGCSGLKSIMIPFVGASKDGTSNTHFGYIFGAGSSGNNFKYVPSSLKTVVITGGTSIDGFAFEGCSDLTSVTIPNSVMRINDGVFRNCSSLTSIVIPDSVTHIGLSAFNGCTNLKQLILFPSTPPSLGSNSIPTTVQTIYVQQSSKAAYQTAANWAAFATEQNNKIVSDNLYLSFVRFNQKNKQYFATKIGLFPLGYIYITTSSTSPAEIFGGAWERIKDVFLLSAGNLYTVGSTGGEATHKLTIEEMPSHSHELNDIGINWSAGPLEYSTQVSSQSSRVFETNKVGGDQAHNNMPPYLAVYMWRRIF